MNRVLVKDMLNNFNNLKSIYQKKESEEKSSSRKSG